MIAIRGCGQQIAHDIGRVLQIGTRLEERHNIQSAAASGRVVEPGFARQQQYGQHIARSGRHADDIGMDHIRVELFEQRRDSAQCLDCFIRFCAVAQTCRNQRALALQFVAEQRGACLLVERSVILAHA